MSTFFLLIFFEISRNEGVAADNAFNLLNKLAAGIYLLHPAYLYTLIPRLALHLHSRSVSFSSTVGVSWLVLVLLTLPTAIVFHYLVENPSIAFGYYMWDKMAEPLRKPAAKETSSLLLVTEKPNDIKMEEKPLTDIMVV